MRTPAFQRKPALTVAIGVGKPKPDAPDPSDDAAPTDGDETPDGKEAAAVCPDCGCVFDDATGEVVKEGDPRYPKDSGANDEAGPDEPKVPDALGGN
jgi:hypothetical protein